MPEKSPEGDTAVIDRPEDDAPPAFLKIDSKAVDAAFEATKPAAEAMKAEKSPSQAGKLPRHIEKAMRERDELNAKAAAPKVTPVVVPMGRARGDRKALTPEAIKAKAAAAEARSKSADPKAGKDFEFKKGGSVVDIETGRSITPPKVRKAYVEAPFGVKPVPPKDLPSKIRTPESPGTGKPAKKGGKAKPAKAPRPAKAPKPKAERQPRAEHLKLITFAEKGKVPPVHHNFYTAPTHKGYVKRMKELEAMGKKGDLAGLKKAAADPFWLKQSSSRAIVRRWLAAAIMALGKK